MFICGSGSFVNEEEDEFYNFMRATPSRTKRSTSFSKILGKHNDNKNPFSDRGLDKFNALLANHDDKKQKIFTEMGSKDISFVRFVYANGSEYAKPIVVRANNKKKRKQAMKALTKTSTNSTMTRGQAAETVKNITSDITLGQKEESSSNYMKKYAAHSASFVLNKLRQPLYLLPMIIMLIISCVTIFGRSFAIMCTTIMWYLLSNVIADSSSSTSAITSSSKGSKPEIKKEYARKLSSMKNIHSEGPSSPTKRLQKVDTKKIAED